MTIVMEQSEESLLFHEPSSGMGKWVKRLPAQSIVLMRWFILEPNMRDHGPSAWRRSTLDTMSQFSNSVMNFL